MGAARFGSFWNSVSIEVAQAAFATCGGHDGLWIAYSLNLPLGNIKAIVRRFEAGGFHCAWRELCPIQKSRCAYCGEPLAFNAHGVQSWRTGNEFVCNEFCADGLSFTSKDIAKTTLYSE